MLMRIDNRTDEEREAEDGPQPEKKDGGDGDRSSTRVAVKPAEIIELPTALHPLVYTLMKYMTDRRDMNNVMSADFSLDVKRMPLGRITKAQIKDAYEVLAKIEDALKLSSPSSSSGRNSSPTVAASDRQLVELSNMFYTLLPHYVSTHQRLPAIDNAVILSKKIDLVESLGDMEIANAILSRSALTKAQRAQAAVDGKPVELPNRMDQVYESLGCAMVPMDMVNNPIAHRIIKYAEVTRGRTHSVIPTVEQIYEISRPSEQQRWDELCAATAAESHAPQTNVRMLWHGSRKTNFLGILSQGLRIAPPEAPSTGYMFGKGIYFADVVSKASNYCHPVDNKGLMILSEMGLGRSLELGQSKFVKTLDKGFYSTKGVGKMAPSAKELHDGVTWPIGLVKKQQHPRVGSTSLYYPEYIIYNPAQYRMRYIIQMTFRRG